MREQDIQNKIRVAVSRFFKNKITLFRNNTATGWVGKVRQTSSSGIYIENQRPLIAGLCVGSSDLIGWKIVTIDESMVGKDVAIFTAVEVKTTKGRLTKEQEHFIDAVNRSGGIAIVATSENEAVQLLK